MTSSSGRSMTARREGDRRGRVPTVRLDDQPDVRDLIADELAVAPIRDAEDVVLADERRDPAHGPLEEGLVAEERQEGLRALRPAERPEPGPASAGQDHDVHGRAILGRRRPARPADRAATRRPEVAPQKLGGVKQNRTTAGPVRAVRRCDAAAARSRRSRSPSSRTWCSSPTQSSSWPARTITTSSSDSWVYGSSPVPPPGSIVERITWSRPVTAGGQELVDRAQAGIDDPAALRSADDPAAAAPPR